jgi:hypothetical protein
MIYSRAASTPLGAAEVVDAGVGANTCAREGDDVLSLEDPSGDRLDVPAEVPFPVGHGVKPS